MPRKRQTFLRKTPKTILNNQNVNVSLEIEKLQRIEFEFPAQYLIGA